MKKILFALVFVFIALTASPAQGVGFATAGSSAVLVSRPRQDQDADWRYLLLYRFLKNYDSPLTEFSGEFIKSADSWGVDWRLVPAITGLESFFGKRMVPGTYNAYGWGGGYIEFESWEDSIDHVTMKIKQNYHGRGLTTPLTMGPVYAPPNPRWGALVLSIMNKI